MTCRRQEHKPSLKHIRSSPNSATNNLTSDLTSLHQSCLNHNRRKSEKQRPWSFLLVTMSCKIFLPIFIELFFFLLLDDPLEPLRFLVFFKWLWSFVIIRYQLNYISVIKILKHPLDKPCKGIIYHQGKKKTVLNVLWCARHCARCTEACHSIFTAILWGTLNFLWWMENRNWGSEKVTKLFQVTNSLFYLSI